MWVQLHRWAVIHRELIPFNTQKNSQLQKVIKRTENGKVDGWSRFLIIGFAGAEDGMTERGREESIDSSGDNILFVCQVFK